MDYNHNKYQKLINMHYSKKHAHKWHQTSYIEVVLNALSDISWSELMQSLSVKHMKNILKIR